MASPKEGATKTQNGKKYVYRNGQWRPTRFRTPANDLIEGTSAAARNTTQRTTAAASSAASQTADREKQARQQAIGLRGRNQKPEAMPVVKPTAKPAAKPTLSSTGIRDYKGRGEDKRTMPTGSKEYNEARNRQIEAQRQRLKGVGNTPAKPSPAPSAGRPSTSSSSRSSSSTSSTPKPAGKVPASNAGMKNQNKDFRGNPNRKDSIASTLSELRSMGSGRKVEGVGPVASGSDYAKSKNISQAQSDANKARIKQGPGAKNETLKERMERMKKRRQGTSIGGVD